MIMSMAAPLPRLDRFLHAVADAVIVADVAGQVVYLNPATERLTAWAANEALGRPVTAIVALQVAPGDAPWPESLVRVLAGGPAQEYADTLLRARGGESRRVNLTLYPVHADGGGSAGAAVILRDISDLYRLREERRIAAMAFEIGAPQAVLDAAGRVIRVNDTCATLSGYGRKELVGMSLDALYAHPSQQVFRSFFADPGPPDTLAARTLRRTKAGRRIQVNEVARKIRDPHGRITHFAITFHDLTEIVAATTALAESRHTLAQLMDLMHDGLAVLREGRIIDCNQRFATMAGRPREEVIGLDPVTICGPWQPGGVTTEAGVAKVMATIGGGGHTLEDWQITRPDGSVGYFEASISRAVADGLPVLLIAARDVTERRRAEAERQRLLDELAAREKMVRLSNRAYGIASWELDPHTRHLRWSDDAENVLGLAPGTLTDGVKALEDVILAADQAQVTAALEQVFTSGEGFTLEVRIRDRDGNIRWTHTQAEVECDALGRVQMVRGAVADITERKAAQQTIEHLAFFDPLTGLPNRRLLFDRLEHALAAAERGGHCGALLFIDLDHFKRINDSLGHDAGDRVLCEVAARLRAVTRAEDTVARLGGDEFVVLIDDLRRIAADNLVAARDIATRVLDQLSGDYRIGAHDYRLSASVGVILFPEAGKDSQALLQRADAAMYQAKAEGRGRVSFYQSELQAVADARLVLERELRAALAEDRFELYYQPKVEGENIVGVEVLLRWHHPERGLLAPAEFIAVAEQTGLIVDIGAWVIDTACRQLAAWDRALGGSRDRARLDLSVNLSPIQLRHRELTTVVEHALAAHGIESGRLTLEITEGVLVDDVAEVTRRLQALKTLGVRLSIDDFGIGYASLSYLKRLPIDELKIDRSFVANLVGDRANAAIVESMIGIARAFSLQVVAEGVETRAEADALLRLGCRLHQGYLYSRPLPAGKFAELLLQRPLRRIRS